MGEPAVPNIIEREARQKLATAIVDAVRNDEAMPLGLHPVLGAFVGRSDVEALTFQLAQEIEMLRNENVALTKVFVTAARLRQYPVPFDDHFELVGAVDECRAVLEPPIDDWGPKETKRDEAR